MHEKWNAPVEFYLFQLVVDIPHIGIGIGTIGLAGHIAVGIVGVGPGDGRCSVVDHVLGQLVEVVVGPGFGDRRRVRGLDIVLVLLLASKAVCAEGVGLLLRVVRGRDRCQTVEVIPGVSGHYAGSRIGLLSLAGYFHQRASKPAQG